MLALEWYKHTPLPDAPLPKPTAPGLSELSRRVTAAFDGALYCDVALNPDGAGEQAPVLGHRVVLRRNPALGLDTDISETNATHGVPGVRAETLRAVVRAHYMDVGETSGMETGATASASNIGSYGGCNNDGTSYRAALLTLRELPGAAEEWPSLESAFGPLPPALPWLPLRDAVSTDRFTDCALHLQDGSVIPAHRALVAGIDDGHYFSAALRWPGGRAADLPTAAGSVQTVAMPASLSREALTSLLLLRYGALEAENECVLEMRHFAELFDWTAVRAHCETILEALLADAASMDTDSLLAVVTHAEESVGMPPHLKAAALAAAVRQWGRVTEAAGRALPATRCEELNALNRIRNRDGHVCGSLEEYLHAACDDLTEWERGLTIESPLHVRRQIEGAWQHWFQLVFEYGHIFSAKAAEQWRAKILAQREEFRAERARLRAEALHLPVGRIWFEPTADWHEVPPNAVCPGGLEYRCDMQTGRNFARLVV